MSRLSLSARPSAGQAWGGSCQFFGAMASLNSLYLPVISPFFLKNVFLLILGLRVFGVGTRTPFTGGAEAL
ncbi:hypothetical protein PXK17_21340, partial [Phaeobacter gallaeciensis]|nr:hypothetical protein [Phaeobacter gallaeciensis]MDE4180984.1 hypothetical protein [Phaeobacter gallaeciensis]MDE4185151.1 hypothetical protein [Phaeobacter gallaeciensis]MDE4197674.1 hypothetical protein [Phaeobacter gallaeciensis]